MNKNEIIRQITSPLIIESESFYSDKEQLNYYLNSNYFALKLNGVDGDFLTIATSIKNSDKTIILELSDENYSKALNNLKELNYLDKTIVISKNIQTLLAIKSEYKNINLQFKTEKFNIADILPLLNNDIGISLYYTQLTKELIDNLHSLNMKISCYIVNEKDIAELLSYWKVDYIITAKDLLK